jgi:hypothetical protein
VVAPEHVQMLRNWQEHQRSMAEAEAKAQAPGGHAEDGSAP